MSATEVQQAAEFFAKLANSYGEQWEWRGLLTEAVKANLSEDFKRFLIQNSDTLSKSRREWLSQSPDAGVLFFYLKDLAKTVWMVLSQLLKNRPVDRGQVSLNMWLRGRSITIHAEPLETAVDEYLESQGDLMQLSVRQFYEVLEHRPFPFGQCRVCKRIFVQMGRGKPQKYCSTPCRAKGLPSAIKRTEYVRVYRAKKREQDITVTCKILQTYPPQEHVRRLEEEFPRKSRRQLVYLIKQAKQVQQCTKEA